LAQAVVAHLKPLGLKLPVIQQFENVSIGKGLKATVEGKTLLCRKPRLDKKPNQSIVPFTHSIMDRSS
jgi:cation transport ATPase